MQQQLQQRALQLLQCQGLQDQLSVNDGALLRRIHVDTNTHTIYSVAHSEPGR